MQVLNRDFKFRAWGDVNYITEAIKPSMYYCTINELLFNDGYYLSSSGEDVNDYFIMQYTGLKDEYGKDIYEGDIVLFISQSINASEVFDIEEDDGVVTIGTLIKMCVEKDFKKIIQEKSKYKSVVQVVRFNDGQFVIDDWGDPLYEFNESCIVIGNIYENPELLKL